MRQLYTSFILIAVLGTPALAQNEDTYEVTVTKKQDEKTKGRWTLAEWLAQKQRNQMMDLWLAQNSHSSPYEFFIEGQSINYTETNGHGSQPENHDSYSGQVAAYASIAGLRGGYEGDGERRTEWFGSFNLRVLGRAIQDTHINLEGGIQGLTEKSASPTESVQNTFGRVSTDLYLTKKFGLEGSYTHIFPATSNVGRIIDGEGETGGLFIDFSAFRVYGEWRREFLHFAQPEQSGESEFRDGWGGGIRIFF